MPMEPTTPSPTNSQPAILHNLRSAAKGLPHKILVGLLVVAVFAGVGTGYVLSRTLPTKNTASTSGSPSSQIEAAPGATVTGNKIGIQDTKTFSDCAQGQLEKGGIQGEGTHHLIREGGPSQTAYLTSSVVDLDQFVGKTVKVCGQTIASQHAGWLMDVGIVTILQ